MISIDHCLQNKITHCYHVTDGYEESLARNELATTDQVSLILLKY